MRDAAGGGKAWISSLTKRAAPGSTIDIPLAHKDALYVRSHYDGITITMPDAPLPNEIAVICAYASRGRPEPSRRRTCGKRHQGHRRTDLTHADPCRRNRTEPTMTTCKTGAEHIKSLQDGRTVYIDGKLVPDVTTHPAFENSIKSTGDAL